MLNRCNSHGLATQQACKIEALYARCVTAVGEHGGVGWEEVGCLVAAKGCKISEILQMRPNGEKTIKRSGRQHSLSYTDLLVMFLINTPSPSQHVSHVGIPTHKMLN